jgi:uncharacterized protein YqeY
VESSLKKRIEDDVKAAMRGGDKPRLGTLRLVLAAVKQQEVDTRNPVDDTALLAILDKMIKQRRDSITQFQAAGRQELVDKEAYEIGVIQEYLPPALEPQQIAALISDAIAKTGATSPKDMGKVMGLLKPQVQGRADMTVVSKLVQAKLSSA